MWCIARIKNDDNQMGKHEACIYQYGKKLFFNCLNSKKRLQRPHRTLYHHVETLIPCGFSHVCPHSVLKALARYFCKVGRDFLAYKTGKPCAEVLYVISRCLSVGGMAWHKEPTAKAEQ